MAFFPRSGGSIVPSRRLAVVAGLPLSGSEEGTMRTLALAAAIVGCLAMSGCAGTNDLARGESRMDNDLDASKVLTVNEWAVHRHATVMWVNYPKRSAHPKETDG
jgi:hypothetical protein